jgi:lysophospholipase L1-like esterase
MTASASPQDQAPSTAPQSKPPATPPSARKERVFRWIMFTGVVVFVLLGCLGAELGARYYERHRATPPDYFPSVYYPHRRLRYGLVPNSDYYGWFRINSHGFRGREVSVAKPAGVLRIVCLGGSTTFDGGSVGKDRPWPEVLEAELRKRLGTSSIEVLNLGIGGATSLDSLIDLQMRALAFQPDLIVVYQAHNDLIYSIPPSRPENSPLFPLEDRPRSNFIRWLTYNSLLYAKTEERVVNRASNVLGAVKHVVTFGAGDDGPAPDREVPMERGLTDFASNMKSIAAIAQTNGIPLVLPQAVIPFPAEGQTDCGMCNSLSNTYGSVDIGKLKSMFARYDKVLTQLAEGRTDVHYIPTDGFVPDADRYYIDPVHFGPQGSLAMGTKLAEALEGSVRQLTKP